MKLHQSRYRIKSGFTLIEITIALAIVALVCVVMMGLLPIGLTSFQSSLDATISTQIISKITDELKQTDFDTLIAKKKFTRWFTDYGVELTGQSGTSLYLVTVNITPASLLPNDEGILSDNLANVQIMIQNPQSGSLSLNTVASSLKARIYNLYIAKQ